MPLQDGAERNMICLCNHIIATHIGDTGRCLACPCKRYTPIDRIPMRVMKSTTRAISCLEIERMVVPKNVIVLIINGMRNELNYPSVTSTRISYVDGILWFTVIAVEEI